MILNVKIIPEALHNYVSGGGVYQNIIVLCCFTKISTYTNLSSEK